MSRRKHMSGAVDQSVVPRALKRKGIDDPMWESVDRVAAWCERYGVAMPHEMFHDSPRALRDQVTFDWTRARWPGRGGLPDWHKYPDHDIAPMTSARVTCRVAWQARIEQRQ